MTTCPISQRTMSDSLNQALVSLLLRQGPPKLSVPGSGILVLPAHMARLGTGQGLIFMHAGIMFERLAIQVDRSQSSLTVIKKPLRWCCLSPLAMISLTHLSLAAHPLSAFRQRQLQRLFSANPLVRIVVLPGSACDGLAGCLSHRARAACNHAHASRGPQASWREGLVALALPPCDLGSLVGAHRAVGAGPSPSVGMMAQGSDACGRPLVPPAATLHVSLAGAKDLCVLKGREHVRRSPGHRTQP